MSDKLKKAFKVFSIIAAIVGIGAAIYLAVTKLKAKQEPEYFDDNDFFECDNEIEVVEVKDDDAKVEVEEKEEEKKAPKKAANKKSK